MISMLIGIDYFGAGAPVPNDLKADQKTEEAQCQV